MVDDQNKGTEQDDLKLFCEAWDDSSDSGEKDNGEEMDINKLHAHEFFRKLLNNEIPTTVRTKYGPVQFYHKTKVADKKLAAHLRKFAENVERGEVLHDGNKYIVFGLYDRDEGCGKCGVLCIPYKSGNADSAEIIREFADKIERGQLQEEVLGNIPFKRQSFKKFTEACAKNHKN